MRKLIGITIFLAVLTGCASSVQEAKVEAYQRWNQARAQVLYGVAVEHFKVGQLDLAGAKATESLALDDKYAQARILLGKVYIEQGNYSLAVRELEAVHRHAPRSPEVNYLLGVAHEKAKRLDEALKCYRLAHALDTANLSPVMAAAEVLVAMERVREAQVYVESYLRLAETEPGMYELAGRLAMMRKQYELAGRYYEHALDLNSRNVRYHEALGKAQFFAGQYDRARETLRDLAQRKDYDPPAWVHTMLGDCCVALGRLHQARDAYLRAAKLQPADAGLLANVAKVALALKDEDRAILAARQSLHLSPGRLDATLLLGYALLRRNQGAEAVRVLAGARDAHRRSVTLWCLLGRAHGQSGDPAEARRCYATALQLEPGHPLARELLAASDDRKLSKTQ